MSAPPLRRVIFGASVALGIAAASWATGCRSNTQSRASARPEVATTGDTAAPAAWDALPSSVTLPRPQQLWRLPNVALATVDVVVHGSAVVTAFADPPRIVALDA